MVIILNRGALSRHAIELIGFTTKDGSSTVGQFGSGTSYAIALALRLGLKITISSKDELGPYTLVPTQSPITVGDTTVMRIVWEYRTGSGLVKSWGELGDAHHVPSSLSVELGVKDWEGVFPVVREFVSNARDADPKFACYQMTQHIDKFLTRAQEEGIDSITVVKIENVDLESDEEDQYDDDIQFLDNDPRYYFQHWDDYFRWKKHGTIYDEYSTAWSSEDGFEAIYRKKTPSPVVLFVKGVRCPWPSSTVPISMYDYGLNIGLSESRTIKSDGQASTAMTYLWTKVGANLLSEMLAFAPDAPPGTWETTYCNEFVKDRSDQNVFVEAWKIAHGDMRVSSDNDPHMSDSVIVPRAMRDLLVNNGVQHSLYLVEDLDGSEKITLTLTVNEANLLLKILDVDLNLFRDLTAQSLRVLKEIVDRIRSTL